MTQNEALMANLTEASRIAKTGEDTPLVGGPIGLMWGVLLTTILTFHYMIITQALAISQQNLLFFWLAFVVIGVIGSIILGKKLEKRPGAYSTANRVESYVWTMYGGMMGALSAGVFLNQLLGNGSYELWTLVVIFGFAGQGLAYGVVGKLTGQGWLHFASFTSFAMAAMTMSFYNSAIIYLLAALGAFVTIVIPSIMSIRKAG